MSDRRHVVIAYDIADDARRRRVAKLLEARLERVQASVFEGRISEADLIKLEAALQGVIEHDVDSLRVHRLCQRCRHATTAHGAGPSSFEDPGDVVL